MEKTIKIELTPHDAVIIASFHAEFSKDAENIPQCASLLKAMNNYFNQCVENISKNDMEMVHAEIEVNILLGNSPDRPGRL